MTAKPPRTEPCPGLVIRYAYVWRDEATRGREEGKDRPCAVVLAIKNETGRQRVYVAPITHSPPGNPGHAIEIPAATARRLGLDDLRSWIKTDDLNAFTWPGPDLRPVGRRGEQKGFAYGLLPQNMTQALVDNVRERAREGGTKAINRDELKRMPPRSRDRKRDR